LENCLLQTDKRSAFNETHEMFRLQVRRFFAKALLPNMDAWETAGIIDRKFWLECGEAGLLCPTVPVKYGGLGADFAFNAVINEELAYAGSPITLSLQSDIVCDYILNYGSEAQRALWLPRMISGEVVTAIAMTEPGAGSDLQGVKTSAVHSSQDYVINGSKTYISNGQLADLIIVVARTASGRGSKGLSLILVEAERAGFSRGRNLDKIGQFSADTSELFFSDVRVPLSNCLGQENEGFKCLMDQLPQERLSIAISAQAHAQRAFDEAVKFTKNRTAFGAMIFDFQNTRFSLATLACKLQVGWAHLDWAINRHLQGKLTSVEASAAKLFHTELQWECCDVALQLHGGAGYMNEYPIARLWRDARASRIYGGTSEIMKEVIGRAI
jgi:acyl-CoA dehydrogenase